MARCGRCGLWSQYPEKHAEKKYAGTCLYYQSRLAADEVYEERRCPDFLERIPGLSAMQHFDYKVRRDNLGDAFRSARRAKRLAYVSLVLSIASLLSKLLF